LVFGATLTKFSDWHKTTIKTFFAILIPLIVSIFHFVYYALIQKPLSEDVVSQGFNFDLFLLNLYNSPKLILGVFGSWGLGWLDTPLPQYLSIILICLAILNFYFNSLGSHKKYFVILCLLMLVLYPSIVLTIWGTTVGGYFQPRYLLPSVASMSFAVLYSLDLKSEREIVNKLYRWNVIVAVMSYSISLYINILRYSKGIGPGNSKVINSGDYWSFPYVNPWACFLVGTLSMMLGLLLADKFIKENSIAIRDEVSKVTKRKSDKNYRP
jgi:hypothetical protein